MMGLLRRSNRYAPCRQGYLSSNTVILHSSHAYSVHAQPDCGSIP